MGSNPIKFVGEKKMVKNGEMTREDERLIRKFWDWRLGIFDEFVVRGRADLLSLAISIRYNEPPYYISNEARDVLKGLEGTDRRIVKNAIQWACESYSSSSIYNAIIDVDSIVGKEW